jgi:hypothetical protein
MKPWRSVEPIIPRKQAHRLSLVEFDTSALLSVDRRGLEERNTGDKPADFGSTKTDSESVSMSEPNTHEFMEKFNNPLTEIEQEQLKLFALQNPRDKSLHRMVKLLVGLTEKVARDQKRSSKKLKDEETVKQEDTPALSELAVDWARENTGEQKEGEREEEKKAL